MSTFIVRELTGPNIRLGHAAMSELRGQRPPLASPQTFQAWVSEQASQGYRLAASFDEGEEAQKATPALCWPGPKPRRGGWVARVGNWIRACSASWAEQRP